MNTTVINHSARTITTYEVTPEVVESVKDLFSMFHSDVEPVYSLGFQRYLELSRAKYKRVSQAMLISGVHVNDLMSVLKAKLETMTDAEFKAFKKAK
ncbi:hypothetical protein EG346_16710 [Chryseobacterium carnipullorum]|uniref:Uncharacterized protein n=1 Tax=Chryseobacterium carnipullorum TaxID=1124835 RepID=A0A376DVR2_CHRCU|nr:hypothetical protein [Chryseobacterium carnipullorum]AZA49718.1 hypothetical protein EG346_16710 [Chryseobacterium carnipullorum]AZA64609.1 hypothetical protein EG345_07735 [Chryseobacterium carnipullorum]STC95393.1 Uncharacterised protein [Chryseobacterium carnipullorum]